MKKILADVTMMAIGININKLDVKIKRNQNVLFCIKRQLKSVGPEFCLIFIKCSQKIR